MVLTLHFPGKKHLGEGWIQYQRLFQSQRDLRRSRFGARELQEALERLPRLKTFRMSTGHSLNPSTEYLKRSFSAGLERPCGNDNCSHSAGVPELRSVLLSMHYAGIQPHHFACGDVSWKLFRCSKSDLRTFAFTLARVKYFQLQINTGFSHTRDEIGTELPECRRFLQNGRFRDLITAANDIEDLHVQFDWARPVFGITLNNIVGDHIWPKLITVCLSHIETTEKDLIGFLERHKRTIRSLHLDTMCLTSGEWNTTIPRIRSSLELDFLFLEGHMMSDVPWLEFDLGMIRWDDARLPEDRPRIEKRKAISEWFTHGGECPFVDDWSIV